MKKIIALISILGILAGLMVFLAVNIDTPKTEQPPVTATAPIENDVCAAVKPLDDAVSEDYVMCLFLQEESISYSDSPEVYPLNEVATLQEVDPEFYDDAQIGDFMIIYTEIAYIFRVDDARIVSSRSTSAD